MSRDLRFFDPNKYYLRHLIHGTIITPPFQENEYSNACEYKIDSNGQVIDVIAFDSQCAYIMAKRSQLQAGTNVAVKGLMGIDKDRDNLIIQSTMSITKGLHIYA